jgi:CRP/FNR family transcriptional regulator
MTINTRDMLAAVRMPTSLAPDLRRSLEECGRPVTIESGTVLYNPGEEMSSFLLLSEGSIRVYRGADDGREITLYHVGRGECCTINVLCLLTKRPSPASAQVDEPLKALAYTPQNFDDWFVRYPSMRELVLGQMADRVHMMMTLVEEVAFRKLDRRVAAYLVTASAETGNETLAMTHEAIARDLGSVREVVSRILKNFESTGLVTLGRGKVTVRDRARLANIGV